MLKVMQDFSSHFTITIAITITIIITSIRTSIITISTASTSSTRGLLPVERFWGVGVCLEVLLT